MKILRSTSILAISVFTLIASTWTAVHANRPSIYSDTAVAEATSAPR